MSALSCHVLPCRAWLLNKQVLQQNNELVEAAIAPDLTVYIKQLLISQFILNST